MGVLDFRYPDAPPNRIYDPKTDTWTLGAAVPTNRLDFGVAVVNDTLYAIGGTVRNYSHPLSIAIFTTAPSSVNEQYTPLGYGTIPPVVQIVLPENKTYTSSNVSLTFAVNKQILWISYSLDGQETVNITGNATIAGLANGLHNITIYAKDEFESTGASETVHFAVKEPEPEPFLTTLTTAATVSTVVIVAGLLIYFRKRNH